MNGKKEWLWLARTGDKRMNAGDNNHERATKTWRDHAPTVDNQWCSCRKSIMPTHIGTDLPTWIESAMANSLMMVRWKQTRPQTRKNDAQLCESSKCGVHTVRNGQDRRTGARTEATVTYNILDWMTFGCFSWQCLPSKSHQLKNCQNHALLRLMKVGDCIDATLSSWLRWIVWALSVAFTGMDNNCNR